MIIAGREGVGLNKLQLTTRILTSFGPTFVFSKNSSRTLSISNSTSALMYFMLIKGDFASIKVSSPRPDLTKVLFTCSKLCSSNLPISLAYCKNPFMVNCLCVLLLRLLKVIFSEGLNVRPGSIAVFSCTSLQLNASCCMHNFLAMSSCPAAISWTKKSA
ncbi:hypothetical protein L7F22_022911 [Adiantum nelumboides]|nr:hypothetical protein [Adiantum nelumboides]